MPVEPGKVIHYNGMVNEMHTTAYVPRPDCESHWTYGEVTELPARAERTTLEDMLRIARADLGPDAIIELDQELITSLKCSTCQTVEQVLKPLSAVSFEAGHCPTCGNLRETEMTHVITGEENYLYRSLSHVGVPPLHILRAHNGQDYRFYELTGDLPDALHFRHFEQAGPSTTPHGQVRILSDPQVRDTPKSPAKGRVKLHD
jgi:hypothetical protein